MSSQQSEAFEIQVRDCLTHLYDYAFLQSHPLVQQLTPETTGSASRVQAFRQVITETIESLKPDAEVNSQSAQSRAYRLLMLRYLKQQSTQSILNQLNLSERQFYRDHNKAVQTLSYALLEQYKHVLPAAPAATISVQSEINRIQGQADPPPITLNDFLQKVVFALRGLVDQQAVEVSIHDTVSILPASIDHALLRQTMIWILSQLVMHAAPHSQITLSCLPDACRCRFNFSITGSTAALFTHWQPDAQDTLYSLVTALSGTVFETQAGNQGRISLELPIKQLSVLIIDDNPDAITLFRRYLIGQPYQLFAASDGAQALIHAYEAQPELIVLDIMLPQQDGWEILQTLKSRPETRHIPVLICSVLNTPELALSLGADGFLRKPPGEHDFLNALAQFTRPQPAFR